MSALLKCEVIAGAAQSPHPDESDGVSERSLWSAVLLRAIDDARSVGVASAEQDAEQARQWLSRGGTDFRHVCWLAGMDPDDVQASLRRDGVIPAVHSESGGGVPAIATTAAQDDLVYAVLATAADEGRACPNNADLAKACGWSSRSTAGRAIQRLRLSGRIAIDYHSSNRRVRVITMLENGQRTAQP